MKVECINIYNDFTKKYEQSSHRLTIGNDYTVLGIEIYPKKKNVMFRLVGDNPDKSPALHNASQFEVISGKLPTNWSIKQRNSGTIILSPKPWQELGFWEDFYDHDPNALEIYKREARIIYEEDKL